MHTCYDRGGRCAACACEDEDDRVEAAVDRVMRRCSVHIAEIAAAIDLPPDAVEEHLYELVAPTITKRMGDDA